MSRAERQAVASNVVQVMENEHPQQPFGDNEKVNKGFVGGGETEDRRTYGLKKLGLPCLTRLALRTSGRPFLAHL